MLKPGTIIKADGSKQQYAFISANDYTRLISQNQISGTASAVAGRGQPSLLLLTHDNVVSPLQPSSISGIHQNVTSSQNQSDDLKSKTMHVLKMVGPIRSAGYPQIQPDDSPADNMQQPGSISSNPFQKQTRNSKVKLNMIRSMQQQQQSEQDIEDQQIDIPKLIGEASQQSPLKLQNQRQMDQKLHQNKILSSVQRIEKRSLSKSNLMKHESSMKVMKADLKNQGSPQVPADGDLGVNLQRIKDGKIYFTKNLKEAEGDEQSIFKLYTNDEQMSALKLFESPSMPKETNQMGFIMAPADISLNVHNLASATTNATILNPGQLSSHFSPQKLTAFNINDIGVGVNGKFNAKNIMMIKKFDLEQADEPIDFERDIINDNSADAGCLSELNSRMNDDTGSPLKTANSLAKNVDISATSKKKSKNQKRKLVTSSANNQVGFGHVNLSGKRQNSRKGSQRRGMEERMGPGGNSEDRLKRKQSQASGTKGYDPSGLQNAPLSPSGSKSINPAAEFRKSKNGQQPMWIQNGGAYVFPGTELIDPLLRNSTKNGNVPNALLLQNCIDNGSVNRNAKLGDVIQLNGGQKGEIMSPIRPPNFEISQQNNSVEKAHDPSNDLEPFNSMQSNIADKLNRKASDTVAQYTPIEGYFVIDGQLVRLDNDGRIVHPVMTLGKDIPINSVFEMNNAKNQRDPQMTKMNQIHNKLKLMRGFNNKSQARRNVREVPSVNSNKKSSNYGAVNSSSNGGGSNQKEVVVVLDQRRVTNNSSKMGNQKQQSKSASKPAQNHNYPLQNPYGQQPADYLINVVKPMGGKNGSFPANSDLQGILESSRRDRTISPNLNNRKSSQVIGQVSSSDQKKPPMPINSVTSGHKVAAKTPLKPSSSKFPDYSHSPMKVNELILNHQRGQQKILQTEKKQPTAKLQSLEAMKAQQIQQNNKQSAQSSSLMQPQQLRSLPYRVQKSSSTHVKRSFTSLPEIKNKEQQKQGQNENGGSSSQANQLPPSAQRSIHNQQRQCNTQDRGRLNENSNDNTSMYQDKILDQIGCNSETMLSSINNDLAQIEKFQNEQYEKTKQGDFVIYDHEAKIMTFRSKNSKKSSEVYLYQDLDFQELKKQLEASSNIPAIGCNEVKMKDNAGKLMYQQPENAVLYDLYNNQKCKYSIIQGHKDQDKINQIRKQFGKLKNVKEFTKKLYIPNMQQQYCLFYARFESGNLNRVIQRNQGLQSMEYDLYLQGDTNSEGLMHWYFFKMMTKGLEPGTRIKLNIRNLHRSRSLYEQGMLPKICYEDTLIPDGNQGSGGDSFYPNLIGDTISDEDAASVSAISDDSEQLYVKNGTRRVGWHTDSKVTYSINFFKTDQNDCFDPQNFQRDKQYYTLTFIYEVQQLNEAVFFAYDKPYTYSQDLKKFVDQIRNDQTLIDICQVCTLCKSMGGNDVRMLTITENVRHSVTHYEQVKLHLKKDVRDRFSIKQEIEKLSEEQRKKKFLNYFKKPQPKQPVNVGDTDRSSQTQTTEQREQEKKEEERMAKELENRPEMLTRPENAEVDIGVESKFQKHLIANHGKNAIIITARVHPGEIQASYALEGVLRFLLSGFKKAKELRKKYIFYIVPMLNPDGVIHGNHRTDLAGFDMNRRWADPSPWLHPIMYACKFLTKMIKEERPIDVFCDIHGHFQPTGGFAYCCSYNKPGHAVLKADMENEATLRVIPSLMSQFNPLFQIDQCTFTMEAYKSGSARQVMFNEFKILNSYTLENSFFSRFTDADIDALKQAIDLRNQKRQQKQLKRNQSECSTNSSGEPSSAQKQKGSSNNSTQKLKDGNMTTNKSVEKPPPPFKINDAGCDYADKPDRNFQIKKTADIGLKKNSNQQYSITKPAPKQSKDSSLAREKSSKNLNISVGEISRSHSVQKKQEQEADVVDRSRSPSPIQPLYPSFHHFSSNDHEKLGVDMCLTFHKIFIQARQNGPNQAKAQEDVHKIMAKFYSKLPHNKLPMANAQSIAAAYGSHPQQKYRR